jgi:hypothetical protein
LSGETVICLNVSSQLGDLEAQVFAVDANGTNPYWQSVSAPVPNSGTQPLNLPPAPNGQKIGPPQQIQIHVVPKFWNALTASLVHLNSGSSGIPPDDQITGNIHYNASIGQVSMSLPFSVPVQFYPGLPQLCLFALTGGLMGAFLRSIPGTSRMSLWKRVKPLLALAAWCILFELLGLWIWTQGSPRTNVVILGFDCNPSQLLPAFLMGVLIGLTGLRKLDAAFLKLASTRTESQDDQPAIKPKSRRQVKPSDARTEEGD